MSTPKASKKPAKKPPIASPHPPLPAPIYQCPSATVYSGDSLQILRALPTASVDAVITDPPYSSGGTFRSDRSRATGDKYTHGSTRRKFSDFAGDNRDQRSFLLWSALWMAEAYRIVRPGGYLLTFSDWRQLPTFSDAIQVAGWTWRGIVVWDKTEGCRPQMGWFRAQAEYVLTASHGNIGHEQARAVRCCVPGVLREHTHNATKRHAAAKPVPVMTHLMSVLPQNSTILDPFAGSGTTAVAARQLGHRSLSVEMSPDYCQVIIDRLSAPQDTP